MKKILSSFLALVLSITMVSAIDFTAEASTSYTMSIGDTRALYADTSGKSVVYGSGYWTSNSSAVEIVSQNHTTCTIRAVSATDGLRAYVECRFQYKLSSGLQATGMSGFYITVESPSATSVRLSNSSLTLNKGDGYQLSATVLPSNANQSVSWRTSDIDVLSVNNGYVKALNYGSAYITATTSNGLYASCYVTVKRPDCEHKNFNTSITKASLSENGKIDKVCSECNKTISSSVIYYPKTVTLSATSYTYDGKVKKPTVKVVDSNGKTISSSNYTVTYSSGRKNVGKYNVKITFKGNYSGTITKSFTIKPKNTSISSVSAKSKGFTVKWKKQSTQTTGYQIQYSTSSKFTNAKTVTVSKNSTTSKTISKLSAKKKYYVRIRTYKTVSGTKYYSSWSKAKTVTTKK